jgi:hypothetical protein
MHCYYFADREDFAAAAILALGTARVVCVSHPPRVTSEFEHDGDRYYLVVGAHDMRRGNPTRGIRGAYLFTPCPYCHEDMLPGQALDFHRSTPLRDDPSSIGDVLMHRACHQEVVRDRA